MKENIVKLIADTIKDDKPLDNLFSTSLLMLKQEFPKFSEGNIGSELIKLICYIPSEIVLGDDKDKEKKGKRVYQVDHFQHYENNLLISEEEDIMETGEFIFLWHILEEIYSDTSTDKFGEVIYFIHFITNLDFEISFPGNKCVHKRKPSKYERSVPINSGHPKNTT